MNVISKKEISTGRSMMRHRNAWIQKYNHFALLTLGKIFQRKNCDNKSSLGFVTLDDRVNPSFVISPTFDTGITSDPNAALIEESINRVIHVYENTFTDNLNLEITFIKSNGGLGKSFGPYSYTDTYSHYLAALTSHSTSSDDVKALNSLPPGPDQPFTGTLSNMQIDMRSSLASVLGLSNISTVSCAIYLNTSIMNLTRTGDQDYFKYDLAAVVAHEIDETLGLSSGLDNAANGDPISNRYVEPFDLFRYRLSPISRSFDTSAATRSFLSLDGGVTISAEFNQQQGLDFHDWVGLIPEIQDAELGTVLGLRC